MNIYHMTLASVREEDPVEFDRILVEAVRAAGAKVGADVVVAALAHQKPTEQMTTRLAA